MCLCENHKQNCLNCVMLNKLVRHFGMRLRGSQVSTETGETVETALLMILNGSYLCSKRKLELSSVYLFTQLTVQSM